MAHDVLNHEKFIHPDVEPLLIVLTDGAGNVALGTLPPQEESYKFAELIANGDVRSIVINMEHAAFDQGLAQKLADHLEAPCYTLSELKAENLYHAVRQRCWGWLSGRLLIEKGCELAQSTAHTLFVIFPFPVLERGRDGTLRCDNRQFCSWIRKLHQRGIHPGGLTRLAGKFHLVPERIGGTTQYDCACTQIQNTDGAGIQVWLVPQVDAVGRGW